MWKIGLLLLFCLGLGIYAAVDKQQPATLGGDGTATSIRINSPSNWVDNQDKSYSARFGTPTAERDAGGLELVILPSRAKVGNLLDHSQRLWAELTQGKFDAPNKRSHQTLRCLDTGLNTAVVVGSLQLANLENTSNKKAVHAVMFLIETNRFVTPILFVATQVAVQVGSELKSEIDLAQALIETFVQGIQPNGTVSPC